jgi:hypothetical protein
MGNEEGENKKEFLEFKFLRRLKEQYEYAVLGVAPPVITREGTDYITNPKLTFHYMPW